MVSLVLGLGGLLLADWVWHRRGSWPRWRVRVGAGVAAAAIAIALWALPGGARLEKVLGQLVMPTGILWSALLATWLVAWHRRARGPALAGLAFWLAFSLAGNEVVGSKLLAWLERDYAEMAPLAEEPFEAVFVLGGGTRRLPGEAVQVSSEGDRVVLAARLYHRGIAPILVASGSSIEGAMYPRDLTAESLTIWMDLGVDERAVVRVPEPTNTSQEIAAYAALARERGWERVGLVTSAWHMRRAMRQAEAHEFRVTPLPADIRGGPTYAGLVSLIPSGRGFSAVQRAAWEIVGAAVGR